MTNFYRKDILFSNALAWIFDHCDTAGGIYDYVDILNEYVGMSKEEILNELCNCGYGVDESREILEKCGI